MTEYTDLRGDGRIMLYQRGVKKTWYCRIKTPGSTGYTIKSAGTSKLLEATGFATNLYDELYIKVKQGGSIRSGPTFQSVYDEWEKYELRKEITDRVSWYALPYFQKDHIENIDTARMTEFWLHRQQTYKRKPPSPGTLKRDRTALASLFKYAKARGYIKEIPDLNPLQQSAPHTRRPTFTAKEWKQVTDSIESWVSEDGVATTKDRLLASDYFRILANTGIRVGEARSLRWGDIRRDANYLILEVTGKTGTREVVCLKGTDAAFERVRQLTGDNDLVFSHPNGKEIGSFKRSFGVLLKYAKVPKNGRTIYSLRHYFATQRLMNGVNPYHLAKQMGTSVELLERTYGHVVHSEVAEQILKDNIRQELGADLTAFFEDE